MKRRSLALGAAGLLVAAYGGLVWLHVEAVSYYKQNPAKWARSIREVCVRWQDKYVFGDLRPGTRNVFAPLELSCRQAIRLPARPQFVRNSRGQRIRYLRYASDAGPASRQPILLFVHGISVNYVTGLKYYTLARRLGFELVLMELSNHGWSDNDGSGAGYGCRESADLTAVLEDLIRRFPRRPILVFGTSMGAMTIADDSESLNRLASHVRAVILENPQSSLRDILGVYAAKMHLPDFHTDLVTWLTGLRDHQDFSRCAPYLRVETLKIPTWVEISARDFMVPIWMAEKVYAHLPRQAANRFTVFPYGDHGAVWNGQPKAFEAELKAFWHSATGLSAQAAIAPEPARNTL